MESRCFLGDIFTHIRRNADHIFVILISLIFLVRLLYLDADAKSYRLVTGIPVDEIYYNELAINIYNSGFTGLISGLCDNVTLANAKNFLVPNVVTGASFKIFGLNLYGLRIPYVIMGLISLLLLFYCTKYCFEDNKLLTYGIPIIFLFDFSVLLVSRYALTVIPCMLAAIIYFSGYIYLKHHRSIQIFFLGIWPILTFCLIYNYMVFMIIAGFILLVLTTILTELGIREKLQDFSHYICGIVVGFAVCEIFSLIVSNKHLSSLLLDIFYAHHGKITSEPILSELVINYFYNAISYITSNPFRYNYFILIFALFSAFLYAYIIFRGFKNREYINGIILQPIEWFIILIVGCHWLQNIFLPNLTMTKATITLPFVLLFIGYGITRWKDIKKSLNNEQKRNVLLIVTVASIISIIGLVTLHLRLTTLPSLWIGLFTASCVVIAMTSIYYLLFSKTEISLIVIFAITIIFSMSLAGIFVYSDNTYTDKYVCEDVYNVIGDAPVIGGHSKGFYLYDGVGLNVLVQEYDHYHGVGYDWDYVYQKIYNYTEEYEDIYFFGYAEGLGIYQMDIGYINSYLLNNTPYRYEPVKIYERAVDKGKYNFAIYKKVEHEVV
jgi:hypothetical protein